MNTRLIVIILTVATALIHLGLGIGSLPEVFGIIFVLNGIGYLALLAGLYFVSQLAGQRGLIRYGLIAFAGVTIIGYFVIQGGDAFSSVPGLVTKAIELALIAVLWIDRPATA